jgi:hypothetical protein
MTFRAAFLHSLVLLTVVTCLAIVGCSDGKGHCAPCKNDSECDSGECATFITNSGDRYLLCGNGSSTVQDNCTVER